MIRNAWKPNKRVLRKSGLRHRECQRREFLYAGGCREAIVIAAEKYSKPDLVNLGSGEEISVRDLLEMIRSAVGTTAAVRWDASRPDGQPRRCLDTSRDAANSTGVQKPHYATA